MPCYTKKTAQDICTVAMEFWNPLYNKCEDMGKSACDIWDNCCYWKWSTGAIVGFVIAGFAGLFCIRKKLQK